MQIISTALFTFSVTTLLAIALYFLQRRKYNRSFNREKNTFNIARKIDSLLLQTANSTSTMQKIADFLPKELNFATGVVVLFDKEKNVLRRVAASNTKEAIEAIKALKVPFSEIEISINDPHNLMSRALREKKEFVTNNVHDVFVPVFTPAESLKIQQIMSTQSTIIYPIYVEEKPLGVFIASSRKTIGEITDYEKDIIGVFVDGAGIALQNAQLFTSLKQRTEELKKAKEEEDEFVFIATHDLKTPVTAIDGYISLIEKEKPEFSNDIRENFEEVKAASGRLKQLVDDLLQVARGESGTIKIEMTSVNINEIIENTIKEVTPTAQEKPVKITSHLDPDNNNVQGDIEKLPEVIENLLSNAIKFNRSDGSVTISTRKMNNMIEVSVADTGYGIPKAEQGKVFDKFFKYRGEETKDIVGTGLGLFVVRMLVEKMNGKITFKSIENEGTTFTFTLPLSS